MLIMVLIRSSLVVGVLLFVLCAVLLVIGTWWFDLLVNGIGYCMWFGCV